MVTILKKTDIVLIALLLILSVASYFTLNFGSKSGETVIIKHDGNIYEELPLSKNTIVELNDGLHCNTVKIHDGCVEMHYANCPDGLCINQGTISRTGEIIVCLPNKVTVEIANGDSEFDAVVQ